MSNMKHFDMYFVGVRLVTEVNEKSCYSYSHVNVKNHSTLKWSCVFSVKLEESVFGWGLHNQALWLISSNLARFHLLQIHLYFYSVKISCLISSGDEKPMAVIEQSKKHPLVVIITDIN